MHDQVELVGQHADALEGRVIDRVGRVRHETQRHQRVAPPVVVDLQALVEIFVLGACPGGREIDDRQADQGAEAQPRIGAGLHVREKIILGAGGGASAKHFGDREFDAVGDELGTDYLAFDRPDVFLQPDHQRQVVGDAAQQRHRVVAVAVDQAGDERGVGPRHHLAGAEPGPRLVPRQHRHDAAVADGHRVVGEHHASGLDRDHPAGFDQQVAGLRRGARRHPVT